MLAKVAGKDTQTVVTALIKQAKKLPKELYKSLTWDRGKELTDHRRFTLATNIDVYFCDPQSPWQRGSNENTNGLLRQYFPKGTDLSVHSPMHRNDVDGCWCSEPILLEPGLQEYKIIVDGHESVLDPHLPFRPNDAGFENNYLSVTGEERPAFASARSAMRS
jgi:hypothetical protein